MSVLRRLFAGPPPPVRGDWRAPAIGGEPGLYGLGVGNVRSTPPAPIATVHAIISVISKTCGMLPRHIIERAGPHRLAVDDEQYDYITRAPSETPLRGAAFWEAVFASIEGWGNAYVWRDRIGGTSGRTDALHFLMPQRVTPKRGPGGRGVVYAIEDDTSETRTADEIGHIASLALDGVEGLSPVRAGAITHRLATAAERGALSFFRRGATVGGVVVHEEELNQTEVDAFYENFGRFHAGAANMGNVLLLEGNAKYERIGIPPGEAQFLETRQFEREEILSWYAPGMPHHLLGWRSNASMWGTGVEQQGIGFVTYVLLSRLTRVEEWIDAALLPRELRIRFDVRGLLRADSRARSEMLARMRQAGVLSANEWRALEDLPPRDVVDDYLSPLSMQRIDADSGEPIASATGGAQPPRPPAVATAAGDSEHLIGELRCSSGHLLARRVGAAEIKCRRCGELVTVRAGQVIRDSGDLSEALTDELAQRVRELDGLN